MVISLGYKQSKVARTLMTKQTHIRFQKIHFMKLGKENSNYEETFKILVVQKL